MLNPGPTPGKRRPPPLFTADMQLNRSLREVQAEEAPNTSSKSRAWKKPNVDSPTRRMLSPLLQQQPTYSPIEQPQFTIYYDGQHNPPARSRSFKKPGMDSPTRRILSSLTQQPKISPLYRSYKSFDRNPLSIMVKTPDRPEWSPVTTPSRTPSKVHIVRDVEENDAPEIQESDEEGNQARSARDGSVKENSIPDVEVDSALQSRGFEIGLKERTARLLRPRLAG